MANRLFVGMEPARNCDVIGKADCPAVPGMDSANGILPAAMDCEESAFAGIGCEGMKAEGEGSAGISFCEVALLEGSDSNAFDPVGAYSILPLFISKV